jgi:quinol monooxygenase YgiN
VLAMVCLTARAANRVRHRISTERVKVGEISEIADDTMLEPDKEDGCNLYQCNAMTMIRYSYTLVQNSESQEHLTAHGKTPHLISLIAF